LSTPFDSAAGHYDSSFTYSFTGRGQRKRVWHFLDKQLSKFTPPLSILEINCGTGEDALRFASLGHHVLATDLSPDMIATATKKAKEKSNLKFETADINQLEYQEKFDLIFSNFGGLNCLSPQQLGALNERLQKLVNRDGIFVAVLMPRKCMWERWYFWYKKNPQQRNRRMSPDAVKVPVDDTTVATWFYSPEEFASYFPAFGVESVKPIGIGFPPSYLNSFFQRSRLLRAFCTAAEYLFGNISGLSNYGDHFLIIFKKR
jgi:ubiquinone/menaquinone biosynthesis C-methylase UbiE